MLTPYPPATWPRSAPLTLPPPLLRTKVDEAVLVFARAQVHPCLSRPHPPCCRPQKRPQSPVVATAGLSPSCARTQPSPPSTSPSPSPHARRPLQRNFQLEYLAGTWTLADFDEQGWSERADSDRLTPMQRRFRRLGALGAADVGVGEPRSGLSSPPSPLSRFAEAAAGFSVSSPPFPSNPAGCRAADAHAVRGGGRDGALQ